LACRDESQAAELGKLGAERGKVVTDHPFFKKASIWLQNNRNFQKYDTNDDGVIEEGGCTHTTLTRAAILTSVRAMVC